MQGQYYEAECIDIDPVKRVATCQYVKPFRGGDVTGRQFSVPYDVLIVAVQAFPHLRVLSVDAIAPLCRFIHIWTAIAFAAVLHARPLTVSGNC